MPLLEPADVSEENRLLVNTVREFSRAALKPEALALDEWEAGGLHSVWRDANSIGLTTALLPEEAGGQGLDLAGFALALEEIAAGCAGVAAALLSHNAALRAAHMAGTDVAEWLSAEKDPASLLLPGSTRLGESTLSGESAFAVNSPGSGLLVLLCGGSVCVCRPGMEGLSVEAMEPQMGFRPARVGTVRFDGCACEAKSGLEETVRGTVSLLRLGSAAIAAGLVRNAFSGAYRYACGRYQGGDMIINHQKVRMLLAGMLSALYAGKASVALASESAAEFPEEAKCLGAKIEATGAASTATENAVQVFGGYGYMKEQGMERLMRDAAYCAVYPESNDESGLLLIDCLVEDPNLADRELTRDAGSAGPAGCPRTSRPA